MRIIQETILGFGGAPPRKPLPMRPIKQLIEITDGKIWGEQSEILRRQDRMTGRQRRAAAQPKGETFAERRRRMIRIVREEWG